MVPCSGEGTEVNSLVNIFQIVFEAAVLSNRFEIDEQTPRARLGALLELVLVEMNRVRSSVPEEEWSTTIAIIDRVTRRVDKRIRRACDHDLGIARSVKRRSLRGDWCQTYQRGSDPFFPGRT